MTNASLQNDPVSTLAFFRRDLPHWLVADRAYFVTLRLHGTLPRHVVDELCEERRRLTEKGADEAETSALQRDQFQRIEALLDGLHWPDEGLCQGQVGHMLLTNLTWLRDRGWRIFAAVLMNTHAHILMRSMTGRSDHLVADMDAFKSFTGREANKLTGTSGRFWARDLFDHWVRHADAFDGFVRYIVSNPVKAGLVNAWHNWDWTVLDESLRYVVEDLK